MIAVAAYRERPAMAGDAPVAADELPVRRRGGQVPIDVTEVYATEIFQAFEFLEEWIFHGYVLSVAATVVTTPGWGQYLLGERLIAESYARADSSWKGPQDLADVAGFPGAIGPFPAPTSMHGAPMEGIAHGYDLPEATLASRVDIRPWKRGIQAAVDEAGLDHLWIDIP